MNLDIPAIEQARQALAQWLASTKIVQVAVPVTGTGNPWLDAFGRSANDPDFGEYLGELDRARAADASD